MTARNGVIYEPKGKLRDGYEQRVPATPIAIQAMRASIAHKLERDRLRQSIHRCDETPPR